MNSRVPAIRNKTGKHEVRMESTWPLQRSTLILLLSLELVSDLLPPSPVDSSAQTFSTAEKQRPCSSSSTCMTGLSHSHRRCAPPSSKRRHLERFTILWWNVHL